MTYLDVVKTLRKRGYTEARFYYGTNSESWVRGDKYITLVIRDGYSKRQINRMLNEGSND